MKQRLTWSTKPRYETTLAARRSVWRSLDGRYRVVRSRSLFGLPVVWFSLARGDAGEWRILSRHRKRGPAFARCEREACKPAPIA